MITFKQFEKDERWALHVIKKFVDNHSIMVYTTISLVILFLLASLSIIMWFASVGGGAIEQNLEGQLCSGQLSIEQYVMTTRVVGFVAALFNFISVLMDFVIAGLILFWSYIVFKAYLRYNRDNL